MSILLLVHDIICSVYELQASNNNRINLFHWYWRTERRWKPNFGWLQVELMLAKQLRVFNTITDMVQKVSHSLVTSTAQKFQCVQHFGQYQIPWSILQLLL